MSQSKENRTYRQIKPHQDINNFVEVYWEHKNLSNKSNKLTIFPDSFFKLIIYLVEGKIVSLFLTGLWTKSTDIIIPPQATVLGIKFKILAAEYIFKKDIASLLEAQTELDYQFWNIENIQFDTFENIVKQFESKLMHEVSQSKVQSKKIQLTEILDKMNGHISAEEVSNQIDWSNRQISRYLNKNMGVSLKTYLNIQKCYFAYIQIREGRFFPDEGYYDQAHFIKEIKKHTNKTPKELFKNKNDRFIQLKHIQKK